MRTKLCLLAMLGMAQPAWAEGGSLFDGDQLRGFLDLRAASGDGESSWTEGAFGKTRVSGAGDNRDNHGFGEGMLEWRPHLTWALDGHLTVRASNDVSPTVDVVEAFLSYRGEPAEDWRFSGRAGLFYPPVSLEHEGLGWTTTHTITPSAINSWIGEEVKTLGLEASARRHFGEQELTATLAVFGYNDTSGTLLAYRGWAMHDMLAGYHTKWRLPVRSLPYQDVTEPSRELDHRVGYYARLAYGPIGPLQFEVLHYDNNGDRRSDHGGQTNWETRFTNIGMRAELSPDTHILAQAMTGSTIWGLDTPDGYWVDVDFNSAFLLLSHDMGDASIAGRIEYFETIDKSFVAFDNNDEEGWASTLALQYALSPEVRLALEGLYVSSERPVRSDVGVDPQQEQVILQSSVKLGF